MTQAGPQPTFAYRRANDGEMPLFAFDRLRRSWKLQLVFNEELSWNAAQARSTGGCDHNALRDLQAPVVKPQTWHEVESHARLEYSPISHTQAHGALTPVRGMTHTNGITDTTAFLNTKPIHNGEESLGDIFTGVPWLCHLQPGADALDDGLLGIQELLRRLAEIHRARNRAVIPSIDPGNLEKRARSTEAVLQD